METFENLVRAFGQSLGMPRLAFDAQGNLRVAIEGMGDLFFRKTDQALVVLLSKALERAGVGDYLRALELCHFREARPLAIFPVLCGPGRLAFAARLGAEQATPPLLEQLIGAFQELHHRLLTGPKK
jgi:type III secretion system chaperone SycN